jgi:hypothetical protein
MAYDVLHGTVVLFGGDGPNASLMNDTWEWGGVNWIQRTPTHSPLPAAGSPLDYDPVHSRVLLCGGPNEQVLLWDWDGVDWTDRTPALSPPDRNAHAIAFDSVRDRLVLFGGAMGGVGATFGDTWQWDGAQWVQLAPATSPPVRARHAMAFDPVRGRTVMFGGTSPTWYVYGDTWEWDGTNWTQAYPIHSPPNRFEHSMTFDSLRNRIILFAGGGNGSDDNDTWEWDGVDWTLRNATNLPPARAYQGLAYDAVRDSLVMFGGGGFIGYQEDTWELATSMAATYSEFGSGCAGWAGTPYLTTRGGRPIVGGLFTIDLGNLPPDHSGLVWFGFSRTRWNSWSLPFDLTPIGMPGCSLLASAEFCFPFFNWGGSATWTMLIPADTGLLGVRFYNQAAAIDRSNAFGAIVTNAGVGVIGDS